MLSSSEERRAALQAQLRTLDDHAARDRKEEQRLRNVACELKSQRERHKQDEKRAEVELRCAVIAARRLGLERIKRRIEDVSVERRRAYLRIQVTETPSDRWKWTDIDDAQRTNVQDRYQQLQTLGVEKQILQQEMDELTAQRAVLEAKRVEQRDLIKRS